MAYSRGKVYIWASENHVHFWSIDGADAWEESVWASDPGLRKQAEGDGRPGGVALSEQVVDDFVVMRVAELCRQGTIGSVIARAMETYSGNVGCDALKSRGGEIRSALERVAQ